MTFSYLTPLCPLNQVHTLAFSILPLISLSWQLCFPGLLPGEAAQLTPSLRHRRLFLSFELHHVPQGSIALLSRSRQIQFVLYYGPNRVSPPLLRDSPNALAFVDFPFHSVLIVHVTLNSPAINLNPVLCYSGLMWRMTISFASPTGTLLRVKTTPLIISLGKRAF